MDRGHLPAEDPSTRFCSDSDLGDFLASFAPPVTELNFSRPSRRSRAGVLTATAALAMVGLAAYEMVMFLSRRHKASRANSEAARSSCC